MKKREGKTRARLRRHLDTMLSDRLFSVRMLMVLCVVGGIFFCMNCLTGYWADDGWYMDSFATGERITSVWDIFPSMYAHYFKMNGRLVTHFLAQLFLMLDKMVFNMVNTLCFLALGVIVYWYCGFFEGKRRAIRLALIFIFLYYLTPGFWEDFLWVTGASNYLYGMLLVLLFLIPYRRSLNQDLPSTDRGPAGKWLCAMIMLPLGAIAGATNENLGGMLVCVTALVIGVQAVLYKKKPPLWMFTGCLGSLAGCIFMLSAPGNSERTGRTQALAVSYGENLVPYIPLNLFTALRPVISSLVSIFSYHMVPFVLFALVLMAYFRQHENEQRREKLYGLMPCGMFFVASALSAGAFILSPSSPERVWIGSIVFSMIAIGYVISRLEWENSIERLTVRTIIPWILVIGALASCVNTLWEMNKESVGRDTQISWNVHWETENKTILL